MGFRECNIDAQGKLHRLRIGICSTFLGLLIGALVKTGILPEVFCWMCGSALVVGVFTIFEARAGWCLLRAVGIQTPQ